MGSFSEFVDVGGRAGAETKEPRGSQAGDAMSGYRRWWPGFSRVFADL